MQRHRQHGHAGQQPAHPGRGQRRSQRRQRQIKQQVTDAPGAQHCVKIRTARPRQPDAQRLRQIAAAALPCLCLAHHGQCRVGGSGSLRLLDDRLGLLVGEDADVPRSGAKVWRITGAHKQTAVFIGGGLPAPSAGLLIGGGQMGVFIGGGQRRRDPHKGQPAGKTHHCQIEHRRGTPDTEQHGGKGGRRQQRRQTLRQPGRPVG